MKEIIKELIEAIGAEKVLTSPVDLVAYSFDGTFEQRLPDVVVLPETTDEVSAIVRLASQYDVPVVARGMASGLAGGSIPVRGGIVMSLTRMNRILEIDEENMIATVEAGVVTADLQDQTSTYLAVTLCFCYRVRYPGNHIVKWRALCSR